MTYPSRDEYTFSPIPWNDDDQLLSTWREARTGYPWIDAIVVKLCKWGWMHHLARHCVACFLTCGDLYHRIYSPISFGKKYDPEGNYLRHFLQVLKDMPKEYIYEPWKAPLSIQTKAKCIIERDYPQPVVPHDYASKECKRKLAEAYALNQRSNGQVREEDLKKLQRKFEQDEEQEFIIRKQKQKLVE